MDKIRTRLPLILAVFASTMTLDQLTKTIARETLEHRGRISFLADSFRLEYAENPGAFLSLGASLSDGARFWILSVAVALFLLGAIYHLLTDERMTKLSIWALSLMVGGGLSNLIDRVGRTEGKVIDFLNVGLGNLRTGIFNIADMAIMAGLGLYLLESLKQRKLTKHPS